VIEAEIAAVTMPAPSADDMSVAPRKVTPDADETTADTAAAGSNEKLRAVGDDTAGSAVVAATDKDVVVPSLDPATTAKPGDGGEGSAFANQRDPAMEITIRAQASSWVEIVRNNGEEVMTKLMRNGDSYVVNSNDNLYLSTGNAGGLEVVFHDGTVMSVGDKGEIVRDMPLKIERLKAEL
jgi:cytoskeleton protein RodZ